MRRLVHAWTIFASVALAAMAQTNPEYVDAVTNIGTTTRVIEDAGVKIPVDVDRRHPETVQPRVRHVTHEGTEKNPDAFKVELRNENDASYLVVTPLPGAALPGKYTVRVTLPKLLKTLTRQGDPPPTHPPPFQTIELMLSRGALSKSAAVMSSPLKIQRVIQWNGNVWYEPKEWLIRETTAKAPIFPNPRVTTAHLVSQTTSGLGMVRVTFPDVIEAAQEGRAEVALDGGPPSWIGNASATILLRSDSLAAPVSSYTVEVSSRYSYWWLFLTILSGVALGVATNRVLVPRIASMTARGKAAAERERIIVIRATFIDPEIVAKLDEIIASLDAAISDQQRTADELIKVMNDATSNAGNVVEKARLLVEDLTDRINVIVEAVRRPEAQTGSLRDLSDRTTNRAHALHASLRQGNLGSVERELKDLERGLPYDVAIAIPAWKASIEVPVTMIGRWPGFNVDQDLGSLLTELAAIKEPQTLVETSETLKATERIVQVLRVRLAPWGFKEIREFIREAISGMDRPVSNSIELGKLKDAAEAMDTLDRADLPRELAASAEAVRRVRLALENALAAAWRPSGPDPTVPGLAEGDYRKALREVRAQAPPVKALSHALNPANDRTGAPPVVPAPPPNPSTFQPPSLAASSIRSVEEYANAAAAASWLRDLILGVFVVGGGMLIFMTTYIGTFADFFGALLWGFSVNLGAESVTQYATPLLQRRPFVR